MYQLSNSLGYSTMFPGYNLWSEPYGCYYGAVPAPSWQPLVIFDQGTFTNPLLQIQDTKKQTRETKQNQKLNVREPQTGPKTLPQAVRQKKRIEKDSQYKVKGQNIKRNIFSNVTRHMLNYIRRRKVSLPKVRAIIQRQSLEVTPQNFFEFIDSIKLSNYVRGHTMRQLWYLEGSNKETPTKIEEQNSKILRIISFEFLRSHAHLAVQLAKKIRPSYKTDHHKKIREIIQILLDPFKCL